jgi:hypothetical protein
MLVLDFQDFAVMCEKSATQITTLLQKKQILFVTKKIALRSQDASQQKFFTLF